ERDRKRDVILDVIKAEALKGKAYTAGQFRQAFDNKAGLGSESSIHRRIEVLMTQGQIKIFKNTKNYGLFHASQLQRSDVCQRHGFIG
ncbi:hypothetical protein, partial [Candidatus Liberibacter solanacearum]|uniref:hypothetical protein n=1 Tax=Candidatus Liberibacter solanacearum TaxID=556287 RepID=UPI0019D40989